MSHLFEQQMGVSLTAFRNRQRLERFPRLYGCGRRGAMPRAALDANVGSDARFYRVFTWLMGCTPTATGRELQRAMVEGNTHIHERTSWHLDDDTRRTVRKAWESLGREPEPWMRAEGGRGGSQDRSDTGAGRGAATMLEDLLQEQGGPGHGQGSRGHEGRGHEGAGRDGGPDR